MNSTTFVPYNQTSIFYEPLPFEFLHTNETSPQVIVSVDGIEAVCDSLQCNYNYITPSAQIDSFSLSSDQTLLTIVGSGFTRAIRKITFATIPCTRVTVVNAQTITCTTLPISGTWQPEVIDEFGIIPLTTINALKIPLVITSVTPSLDLNPFGGSTLVI